MAIARRLHQRGVRHGGIHQLQVGQHPQVGDRAPAAAAVHEIVAVSCIRIGRIGVSGIAHAYSCFG
jgi:hypothetical protein